MPLRSKTFFRAWIPAAAFILAVGVAGISQQSAKEAPAGFNTPSFDGAHSVSNGITEPPGDSFERDQQVYEENHSARQDLGPVYNATACVSCHENPNSGGASQITELRVGHNDEDGNFVNPTITINDGKDIIRGRSIVNDRAVCPQAQEHIPATENIRALRAALNTLGDGFVEAIGDKTLTRIGEWQAEQTGGQVHGEAIQVPIFESAGQTRVGRFGWKDQHGSLLSFIADAYLNEMGVTSRLRPKDATTICKTTTDPEDKPDSLGLADIDHFAQFIRGTMVPPRDETLALTTAALHGQELFTSIGCAICHRPSIKTAPAGTVLINGDKNGDKFDKFTVPEALGDKIIHPYGDFLLHDIGTGDGIVQTAGLQETANKLRTAPLWGLRTKSRFMHDLKSLSLENAIERHRGEAHEAERQFDELSPDERAELITFLNSL